MGNVYKNEVQKFLQLTAGGRPFVVFDTETTGLNADEHDVIQLSAVKVVRDGASYKVLEEFDTYINVGYPVPAEITEITGITTAMTQGGKTAAEAAKEFSDFLGENPIVSGYNSISFDQKFLDKLFKKHLGRAFAFEQHFDVIKMAKDKVDAPRKLINLCEHAGVDDKYAFHSSIDDAKATLDVLAYLIPMYDGDEPAEVPTFDIQRISHWRKSDSLDRIYVNNPKNYMVFYDVANKKWVVDDFLERDATIQAVLKYASCKNDEEFLAAYAG